MIESLSQLDISEPQSIVECDDVLSDEEFSSTSSNKSEELDVLAPLGTLGLVLDTDERSSESENNDMSRRFKKPLLINDASFLFNNSSNIGFSDSIFCNN